MSGAIEMIAAPVMPSPETNAPQVFCIAINLFQLDRGHESELSFKQTKLRSIIDWVKLRNTSI
jgi:hypothetical protein